MNEDLQPDQFAKHYPTASCLIGCAAIGAVFLLLAIPIGFALLSWFFQDFNFNA